MIEWENIIDGDDYSAFGPEEDTGEMKFRVQIKVDNLDSAAGELAWYGQVNVVKNPFQIPKEEFEKALRLMGFDSEGPEITGLNELALYEILSSYGIHATVFQCLAWYGKPKDLSWGQGMITMDFINEDEDWEPAFEWVKKKVEEEAQGVYIMLGMYLDRVLNKIGSTGWDFINGDVLRPIREMKK